MQETRAASRFRSRVVYTRRTEAGGGSIEISLAEHDGRLPSTVGFKPDLNTERVT